MVFCGRAIVWVHGGLGDAINDDAIVTMPLMTSRTLSNQAITGKGSLDWTCS